MRTIHRRNGPKCLAEQPQNQDWFAFIGTPCHAGVAVILRQEQQGLCCYCEMNVNEQNSHIEHMEPRSRNPTREYDFTNLAMSCNGGGNQHCGHYKDNRVRNPDYTWDNNRFVPPHDPMTAKLVQYLADGSVVPTEESPDKGSYLVGYLGLNCPRLSNRRRDHARALIDTLGDQPETGLVIFLRQYYLEADTNGRLDQFYSLSKGCRSGMAE